jgi:hypothetical protein
MEQNPILTDEAIERLTNYLEKELNWAVRSISLTCPKCKHWSSNMFRFCPRCASEMQEDRKDSYREDLLEAMKYALKIDETEYPWEHTTPLTDSVAEPFSSSPKLPRSKKSADPLPESPL